MTSHPIIYLIDDDEIDCLIAVKSLEWINPTYKVITFSSTEAALQNLQSLHSDAYPAQILLDLGMPKIDGWEFLEAFIAMCNYPFNNCKVVILTCSVHPEDKQRAKQYACVTDFICKPLLPVKPL